MQQEKFMLVDGGILTTNPLDGARQAQELERLGYAGGFTFEGPHDPFMPLLSAASATEKLELSTAIAVAFARSPMLLAQLAWDLQLASQGRFTLGLGSQIKAHIERRFSMPWTHPAARMRELVMAIRAIWACWHDGEKLDFKGEFFTHTLMPPILSPGPNPFGKPKIYLAGVGPAMTQVAGEVGDGFMVHPLNSPQSIETLTLPSLLAGRQKSGKTLDDFTISCQIMVATGETGEELQTAIATIRGQLAFYASTPAYKVILDCHGWGDLQPELQRMTRENRWDLMNELVSDEMLDTFAVVGHPGDIAGKIRTRVNQRIGRISLVTPYTTDPARFAGIVKSLST
jgi:probable F420-dependent oxidoreductase